MYIALFFYLFYFQLVLGMFYMYGYGGMDRNLEVRILCTPVSLTDNHHNA